MVEQFVNYGYLLMVDLGYLSSQLIHFYQMVDG